MTPRERFHAVMNFQPADRLPYWEVAGFWDETLDRWRQEGLPVDEPPESFFGLDPREFVPVEIDLWPPFPEEVIEENDAARLVRGADGVIRRFPRAGGLAEEVAFPVQSLTDFEVLRRERLDPQAPGRYPDAWEAVAERLRERDFPVVLRLGHTLTWATALMGLENASLAFYDQPDLIGAILEFASDFSLQTTARALADVPQIDMAYFREDLTSATGPLVSPRLIKQHVVPHYRRVIEELHRYGVTLIFMATEGNCDALLPLWLDAGIVGTFPLEIAANQDPVRLRREYPELRLIGGIDKREIAKGREAIDRELEAKVPFLREAGGWIPSLDHAVPPEVSLENYRYYWEKLRELAE